MKVLIYKTYHEPTVGVFTPDRGEGTYGWVYAELLSDRGHDVYVTAPKEAPEQYRRSNVHYVDLEQAANTQYDLAMFFSASPDQINPISSRNKIAAAFNYPNLAHLKDLDTRVVVATPYRLYRTNAMKNIGYRTMLLPMALYKTLEKSKFHNKGVWLQNKFPAHRDFGSENNTVTLLYYKVVSELAKEGSKIWMLEPQQWHTINEPFRTELEEIISSIENLPNVYVQKELCSRKYIEDNISNYSLVIPASSAAGSIQALPRGCVPIVTEDFGEELFYNLNRGKYVAQTRTSIQHRINMLLTNESEFNKELSYLREISSIWSSDQAYKLLLNEIE